MIMNHWIQGCPIFRRTHMDGFTNKVQRWIQNNGRGSQLPKIAAKPQNLDGGILNMTNQSLGCGVQIDPYPTGHGRLNMDSTMFGIGVESSCHLNHSAANIQWTCFILSLEEHGVRKKEERGNCHPKKNYRNSNYLQLTAFPQKCGPFQWLARHCSPRIALYFRRCQGRRETYGGYHGDILGIWI